MTATQEQGQESPRSQVWTIVAGLVAFALGFAGLGVELGFGDVGDLAYRALQLFVLDGGALAPPDGSDRPLQVNLLLQAARFLAPAVTISAILIGLRQLFAADRRRRTIARLRGHVIVCGENAAARALAHNLHTAGRAVVLVASTDPAGARYWTVAGNPRYRTVLDAAGVAGADALYACDDDSASNAAVALAALDRRRDAPRRLQTFAQVRSDNLAEALRLQQISTGRSGGERLDFFNLDEIAARALLEQHPVDSETPVVLGFGRTGEAVMRAIVRGSGAVPARTLVVAGSDAERVDGVAAELDAPVRGWSVRAGTVEDGTGIIYVCLDDEEDALASGLRLAADRRRRVVVCLRRAFPFRDALGSGDGVKIFGLLDEACREEAIVADSIVDRAARTIHENYRRDSMRRGDTEESNPSVVPWSGLPAHLKESNYAQVEHMGRKLQEIGAVLVTVPPAGGFSFTDDEVERLARLEHVRWMTERAAAGFTHGPRREGRLHPDLVDWPNLPAESRQKDVDAVRKLPDVLSGDGIYIARRNPPPGDQPQAGS
jgi:hypothetical protein